MYRFIILLHLISSFSLTRTLLVPYAYVSIKSIEWILLSSFELKGIFLISSVKTLCLSLLNICCVFNINLLFLMNTLWYFLILSISVLWFSRWLMLFSSWVAYKKLLLISNLSFLFMTHVFVPFAFLSSLPSSINSSYKFLLLMQQILSWFSDLIHLSLIQLLFYFFLSVMVYLSDCNGTRRFGFTLKRIRHMVRTYSQMQCTDKYSQHNWIIWPVWLNSWWLIYKLSDWGFKFRCSYLKFR